MSPTDTTADLDRLTTGWSHADLVVAAKQAGRGALWGYPIYWV